MRSHAQVGAFNVRRADAFNLRVSADGDWDSRGDFRGVVPLRAFSVVRSVELEQLGEVNIRSKVFFDGGNVTAETIGRELESACDSLAQISNEVVGTRTFALRNKVRENHFRFAVNRHPNVLVAPFRRSIAVQVGLFCVNECPEFIGLYESRMDAAHPIVEKALAVFPDRKQERKNRALVCASDARDSANTHSLKQERGDLRCLVSVGVVPSKRPLARLRKRGITAGAAITLDSFPSVESEAFYFVVLASQAGHMASPLVFLREKPENQGLGSECGLRPLLDSSLPSVSADGREFSLFEQPQIEIVTHVLAASFTDAASLCQSLQSLVDESSGIRIPVYVVPVKQQSFLHFRRRERNVGTIYQSLDGLANAHLILHFVLPRLGFFGCMEAGRKSSHEVMQPVHLEIPLVLLLYGVRKLLSRIFQGRFKVVRSHCSPETIRSLLK